jgi:predicted regulator of Ras-like GTPase activity (Roadblock/LC7/MglB family)
MPFNAILKNLAERTGALGAIMIDFEGESVAFEATDPSLDMPLVGAHHGLVLDAIKEANSRHAPALSGSPAPGSDGDIKNTFISTDTSGIVLSPLKDGYCLVVVLKKGMPPGRALFESRRTQRLLEKEMG